MNARPKPPLGVANTRESPAESASKFTDVLGRPVGQRVLGLCPDELIRVQLRGIGREPMHMEPLVSVQKVVDADAPVNGATIPEEQERPAHVLEEVAQESDHLHPRDVGAVEPEVQSKSCACGGDGNGRDGGEPISLVAVPEDWRIPDRGPGLADVRDKEEPAFVEKDEMGPKSSGFLLYVATRLASSGRWRPRFSVWLDVPASDTSSPDSSSPATHGPGGSEFRNASRSAWRSAAGSTGLSCIPPRERRSPAVVATCASATGTTVADVQALTGAGVRWPRPGGSAGPNAPPS